MKDFMWTFCVLLFYSIENCYSSDPICVADYERQIGPNLRIDCACLGDHSDRDVVGEGQIKPFSLAEFTHGLSGAIFAKSIYMHFRGCRLLNLVLDQRELTRIGSLHFRPDMKIVSLIFEQIYHLDVKRDNDKGNGIGEYLSSKSEENLQLNARSVSLIVVQRGAHFSDLITGNNSTKLYIDLNESNGEEPINVVGFKHKNIFFLTSGGEEEIPLAEDEDFDVKMRSLTEKMQGKSHMLSLALSLSTIVILLGIFGLIVVANHRQKKRRQLKEILRAKNLGPVLESKKIASEVGNNFLPKYAKEREERLARKRLEAKLPMNTADIEEENPLSWKNSKLRLSEFNELVSSIMYRMRRSNNESHFSPEQLRKIQPLKSPARPATETSFYYKESSLTSSSAAGSEKAGGVGDVNQETVEVEVDKKMRSNNDEDTSSQTSSTYTTSGSSSASSSTSATSSEPGSYVSKISQKVYVQYSSAQHRRPPPTPPMKPPPPPPMATSKPIATRGSVKSSASHKNRHNNQDLQKQKPSSSSLRSSVDPNKYPPDFQGELKEKCMTFFSSVTRSKRDEEDDDDSQTKL